MLPLSASPTECQTIINQLNIILNAIRTLDYMLSNSCDWFCLFRTILLPFVLQYGNPTSTRFQWCKWIKRHFHWLSKHARFTLSFEDYQKVLNISSHIEVLLNMLEDSIFWLLSHLCTVKSIDFLVILCFATNNPKKFWEMFFVSWLVAVCDEIMNTTARGSWHGNSA